MADQKKWFKLWTSVISDDDFDPSRPGGLIGLGRFAALGAYTALHGERGIVEIMADTLFRVTQARTLDELRRDLALKNVSFEEGKNRHGKITVTWHKWTKYQEDSTQAERAKASRSKRRGEERRIEEKRVEEKARGARERGEPVESQDFGLGERDPSVIVGADLWGKLESHWQSRGKVVSIYQRELLAAKLAELKEKGQPPRLVVEKTLRSGWMNLHELDPEEIPSDGNVVTFEDIRKRAEARLRGEG